MENILKEIVAHKKVEVDLHRASVTPEMLMRMGFFERETLSMKKALSTSSTGIISEFKRKSPSVGWMHPNAMVEQIVPGYVKNGASAISILTDETFFGGGAKDLITARKLNDSVPILRKDFVVDTYQIYEAKAMGTDAILLIAAILSKEECEAYAGLAHELGLEVLLEIHTEEELSYVSASMDMIGINNRNLKTFVTDVQNSIRLSSSIPNSYLKVSESGISSPDTVKQLRGYGFKGFLMGENFMKTDDPAEALNYFIKQVQ